MKTKMAGLLALALSVGLSARAWALTSDDVALSVTLSNAVSVLLPTATYDFGPVALSGVSINTSAIPVNNDSGGISETYSLSMVDAAAGWTAATRASGAAGVDIYAVQAMFKSLQPGHVDFAANDNLGGGEAVVPASAADFALDAGAVGEKGYSVTDTAGTHERTLWLRLQMPTTVTTTQANPFATIWVSAAAG